MADEHFLNDWKFAVDSEGVIRNQHGEKHGNNTGSRESDRHWEQTRVAADAPEDVEGYEARRYGENGYVVNAEMIAIVESGLIDEKDAEAIRTDHRVYNREFDALLNKMVGAEIDRPRREEISRVREALREEDAQSGGRSTGRRVALENRLAGLMGGSR